ncbi:hypothetical protein [Aeromonas veronii]|uniref:hypothetical protein n=1 Tax=Aeromonas veronii TaxID=654 RepID=UPI0035BB98D1
MFECYNLSLGDDYKRQLDPYSILSKSSLHVEKQRAREKLREFYIDGFDKIDAKSLKNMWFPSYEIPSHVFISHSHKDIEKAETFAAWLKSEFNIDSFIDSNIWGFAEELMMEINEAHSKISNNLYSLEKANYTSSHVHMMLSSALTEVIDSCECLFFLNTNNSLTSDETTCSPWIMHELLVSKVINRVQKVERVSLGLNHLIESVAKAESNYPKFHHHAHTDHLTEMGISKLMSWKSKKASNKGPYGQLTELYNLFRASDSQLYYSGTR